MRVMSMTTKCGSAESDIPIAIRLHKSRVIYAWYGALDGLSLSYSMVKYSFDVLYTDGLSSSTGVMNDWMMTPVAMAVNAAGSIALIVLSALGNYCDDDKATEKNEYKRAIAACWPYLRDGIKGLKNAFKGVRSTVQVISILSGQDLRYMIIPLGVVLGAVSVLNRSWYRRMKEKRLQMMDDNKKLLMQIKAIDGADAAACAQFRRQAIGQQSGLLRGMAMCSMAYGGFVDGMYLYMGVMAVTALAPQFFVAMAVCSAIFSLLCIVTRMYEEYDYQRKLVVTQANVELALCGKELDVLFFDLQKLSEEIAEQEFPNAQLEQKQKGLALDLEEKMKQFERNRDYLRSQLTLSQMSAFLAGLKNGLAAYQALSSVLFAAAAIAAMCALAFPPVWLISCVVIGIAGLIVFARQALIRNAEHVQKQKESEAVSHIKLASSLQSLKDKLNFNRKEVQELDLIEEQEIADVHDAILDNMTFAITFKGSEIP